MISLDYPFSVANLSFGPFVIKKRKVSFIFCLHFLLDQLHRNEHEKLEGIKLQKLVPNNLLFNPKKRADSGILIL